MLSESNKAGLLIGLRLKVGAADIGDWELKVPQMRFRTYNAH
jgi:hypothetical protein